MLEILWNFLSLLLWVALAILGIAVIIAAFTTKVWLSKVLNQIANYNRWWSFVKALPTEGEMTFIVRGNPKGPFARLLESVTTHWYDEGNDKFIPGPKESKNYNNGLSEGWNKWLEKQGLAYTGFNTYVYRQNVRYTKWQEIEGKSEFGLVEKILTGPSTYFNFNMATRLAQAETIGNFPVSVTVNLTVQQVKPKLSNFYSGGWVNQVVAAVQALLRLYVSTRTINQLRLDKANEEESVLAKLIRDPNGTLNTEILEKFGVTIIYASFVDFDDVSGDEEVSKAIKANEVAKLKLEAEITTASGRAKIAEHEGDATVMTAKKEKEAAVHRADAIRTEYKARVEAGGVHASNFRNAEAIEETELTALGGNVLVNADKK